MTDMPSCKKLSSAARLSGTRPGAPRLAAEAAIFMAAEHVFARHGFKGAGMNEIAQEAGVPKPNIHYYFGRKEELYRRVVENIMAFWLKGADVWLVSERTARDGLMGYVREKLAFSRDRPDACRIFAHELPQGAPNIQHYLTTTLRTHVARCVRMFEMWREAGQIPPVMSRILCSLLGGRHRLMRI